MQVAIFGGAFDPPHLGHQAIARFLLDSQKVDQIWWTPTGQHAFDKSMTAAADRQAMIELIIANQPNQTVFDWELQQNAPSYMLHTLDHVQKTYPEHKFKLIIGSDNAHVFEKWHESEQILDQFPVLVYPRQDFPLENLDSRFELLDEAPLVTVSSTQAREAFAAKQDTSRLVDPKIAEYSDTHSIY